IDGADRTFLHPRARAEATECESQADAPEDQAVAEVTRIECVLGQEDLGRLRGRDGSERDRSHDEYRQERPRANDPVEPVSQVAKMTLARCDRALQAAAGD